MERTATRIRGRRWIALPFTDRCPALADEWRAAHALATALARPPPSREPSRGAVALAGERTCSRRPWQSARARPHGRARGGRAGLLAARRAATSARPRREGVELRLADERGGPHARLLRSAPADAPTTRRPCRSRGASSGCCGDHVSSAGSATRCSCVERGRRSPARCSSWAGAPSSTSTAPPTSAAWRCGPTTCSFAEAIRQAAERRVRDVRLRPHRPRPTTAFGSSRRAGARPRSRLSIRASTAARPRSGAVTREGGCSARSSAARRSGVVPRRRGGAVPLRGLTRRLSRGWGRRSGRPERGGDVRPAGACGRRLPAPAPRGPSRRPPCRA